MASNDLKDENQVNLLLAGRIGNGKSSTGNSILGYRKFTPSSSYSTYTPPPTKETCKISQNRVLNVVDGIDFDCSDDNTVDAKLVSTMAKKAFDLCPEGFSALLIVLRYGARFTKQERDALKVIRSVFGENIVKKHGVVVMTHGDNFDQEAEEHQQSYTFQDWCESQAGAAQSLYLESGKRWVLMNNKAKDEKEREEQRNHLLDMVGQVKNGHLTSLSEERQNHMDSGKESDESDGGSGCFPCIGKKRKKTKSKNKTKQNEIAK